MHIDGGTMNSIMRAMLKLVLTSVSELITLAVKMLQDKVDDGEINGSC